MGIKDSKYGLNHSSEELKLIFSILRQVTKLYSIYGHNELLYKKILKYYRIFFFNVKNESTETTNQLCKHIIQYVTTIPSKNDNSIIRDINYFIIVYGHRYTINWLAFNEKQCTSSEEKQCISSETVKIFNGGVAIYTEEYESIEYHAKIVLIYLGSKIERFDLNESQKLQDLIRQITLKMSTTNTFPSLCT